MEIESIRHKALRKFVETGNAKGVMQPARVAEIIALIDAVSDLTELKNTVPNFGFHALTQNRDGEYAMTITRNWRLTFTAPSETIVADLNIEDYH